ncbi:hypothetical protein RRG08_060010 [Elysia crispata]|uniref:Uncharacterized protein n=1 Tax=Elysia crispata TaxID=231223 RepID=A0AAE0YEZ6_9GAST|nr:hypothetical protein RRG08_060010 [Elysia crispata]
MPLFLSFFPLKQNGGATLAYSLRGGGCCSGAVTAGVSGGCCSGAVIVDVIGGCCSGAVIVGVSGGCCSGAVIAGVSGSCCSGSVTDGVSGGCCSGATTAGVSGDDNCIDVLPGRPGAAIHPLTSQLIHFPCDTPGISLIYLISEMDF